MENTNMETSPIIDFAKLLKDALAPIAQEIAYIKAGNINKSRKQILEESLQDINPTIKAKFIKNFDRMKIESDDEFKAFVEETIVDANELISNTSHSKSLPEKATEKEIDAVFQTLSQTHSDTQTPNSQPGTEKDPLLNKIFKSLNI